MSGHHHNANTSEKRVLWAVVINVLLTFVQIAGGLMSGSLSLVADAIHNFSDAASLAIAYAARRISRRPADGKMTYGYGRAEIVAALINYTTLIVIGLYLVYEAVLRIWQPEPIAGWIVVIVAAVALIIDIGTAFLTYTLSRESMNIRAAFLHNVSDALGSVAVIVAGTAVLLYDWQWVDPVMTLLIAGYILYQAFTEIGGSIRILMLGAPETDDAGEVLEAVRAVAGVADLHHVHFWQIDESTRSFEAHIVTDDTVASYTLRQAVRAVLKERGVTNATLEVEKPGECSTPHNNAQIGHEIRQKN